MCLTGRIGILALAILSSSCGKVSESSRSLDFENQAVSLKSGLYSALGKKRNPGVVYDRSHDPFVSTDNYGVFSVSVSSDGGINILPIRHLEDQILCKSKYMRVLDPAVTGDPQVNYWVGRIGNAYPDNNEDVALTVRKQDSFEFSERNFKNVTTFVRFADDLDLPSCNDMPPPPPPPPPPPAPKDPLIIDMTGSGLQFGFPGQYVRFDIDADGIRERTMWPTGSNAAFLVLDRNLNGEIDDGSELFGSSTASAVWDLPMGGERYKGGFGILASWDVDRNGVIDARDPIFPYLTLWIDANRNGFADPEELRSLKDAGIKSLPTESRAIDVSDSSGNRMVAQASVTFADGSNRSIYDVVFEQVP